jgi:hypothetical protein
MNLAVAMVQAYLNLNGYFTVVEYPVLTVPRSGAARTVTDLDVLAFRFPHAGHEVLKGRAQRPLGDAAFITDPVLGCPSDGADMIVGEVKEGPARFNEATRDTAVLQVALARFGCCAHDAAHDLAMQLLDTGHAQTDAGHAVRLVAFGSSPAPAEHRHWTTVPMQHVMRYLRKYLRENWEILRHSHITESGLGVLALLEKWRDPAEEVDDGAR